MKALKRADKITLGLITLGALNWGIASITRRDAVKGAYIKRSPGIRTFYGIVGISALYSLIRSMAPKPRAEQRAEKLEKMFERIDEYQQTISNIVDEGRKGIDKGRKNIEKTRREMRGHSRRPAFFDRLPR